MDLTRIRGDVRGMLNPLGNGSQGQRHNVDGIFCWCHGAERPCENFTQVFRNGTFETVNQSFLGYGGNDPYIPATRVHEATISKVRDVLTLWRVLGVMPPAALCMTLVNVAAYRLAIPDSWAYSFDHRLGMDRDTVLLPSTIIEDFTREPAAIARPILDALWNSAGIERCFAYGADGSYTG